MQLINDPSHFGEIETSAVLKVMLKSWTQSNLHWSILQHRYRDLKRLCCRGNPLLPISGLVGNPKPRYFTAVRHRGGWPPRSSRSLLAATLTLLLPAYGRARHGFPSVAPRAYRLASMQRESTVKNKLSHRASRRGNLKMTAKPAHRGILGA